MAFWIFGHTKTPKEILRENQRKLKRAVRDIDRERTKLQNQEKQLIVDIRKMATQGQINAARIMAKDLVRTRNHITHFYTLKSHLQAVSLRIQTLQSTQAMAESMKGAARAMSVMNRQMNLPAMQRILMNFEMESERMNMKEELMEGAIDDIFEEDEEEKDTDDILNQILDDIGFKLSEELVNTPKEQGENKVAEKKVAAPMGAGGGIGLGSGGSTGGGGSNRGPGGGGGGSNCGPGGSGGLSGGGLGGGPGGLGGGGQNIGGMPTSSDPEDDNLMARLDALKKK